MNTLAERLKYAMTVLPSTKVKGVDLARAVDVKPSSVSDWLSGKSKTMEGENLLRAAKYLNVSADWLATGKGEVRSENQVKVQELIDSLPNGVTLDQIDDGRKNYFIPMYELNFCCGDGAGTYEFEAIKRKLPFDEHFFQKRDLDPKTFKLISAKGDSMSPYINDGDAVGVDVSDKDPKEGEVYAIFLDGDQMIKRIFKEGGGVLRLASDNPLFKDKLIDDNNGDSLLIVGRVRYRSG